MSFVSSGWVFFFFWCHGSQKQSGKKLFNVCYLHKKGISENRCECLEMCRTRSVDTDTNCNLALSACSGKKRHRDTERVRHSRGYTPRHDTPLVVCAPEQQQQTAFLFLQNHKAVLELADDQRVKSRWRISAKTSASKTRAGHL